jgi:hypothetical protein
MRIERSGTVRKLTPRLERFFVEALQGEPLDDVQKASERKADFRCLRGLLAIELKTLEKDASDRLDNLFDELRTRPDWPHFFGSAPIDSILDNMEDADKLRQRVTDRIGRAIKDHISKADKQLAAHEKTFPRKSMVKLMVLVNEDHEVYTPDAVVFIVSHFLQKKENGIPHYRNIDGVIFLSERHAASVNGHIAVPIVCIEGAGVENEPWKADVVDLLVRRWARWNGRPFLSNQTMDFTTIEHVPEQMKRYEKWELDYKRNPYMRAYSQERLRDRFDEIGCISSLAFVKKSPLKPTRTQIEWCMSRTSHIMLEMGWRGITITQFKYEPARLADAAKRLRFPPIVIEWFLSDMGRDS